MKKLTILLLPLFLFSCITCPPVKDPQIKNNVILTGAEQSHKYLKLLQNKRVGMIVNQTSRCDNRHLVDFLISKDIQITKIFAPEHGFRGDLDAGTNVQSGVDQATGIPIISIYGDQKKPSAATLSDVDILIFDIQDVGVRYYTYISSMHYMMEAAAEQKKDFIVLDRPNPNGFYTDGPVLDIKFQSFVGMHPIPLIHGMTIGELAHMINGQGWLKNGQKAKLIVIPVANYNRQLPYSPPVKPSPNLPNDVSIALYPSLGFFEATPISIGRGTEFPFQVIGYDKFGIGNFVFQPYPIKGSALNPKLNGKLLSGLDLRRSSQRGLNIDYIIQWHHLFRSKGENFFERPHRFDELAGSDQLRKMIEKGLGGNAIRKTWENDLKNFIIQRQDYLLYP